VPVELGDDSRGINARIPTSGGSGASWLFDLLDTTFPFVKTQSWRR